MYLITMKLKREIIRYEFFCEILPYMSCDIYLIFKYEKILLYYLDI